MTDQESGSPSLVYRALEQLKQRSAEIDGADGPSAYQSLMIALALETRHFLRRHADELAALLALVRPVEQEDIRCSKCGEVMEPGHWMRHLSTPGALKATP